eukprot:Sspe_Gene.15408::Locus_5359_Transcript_1_3_Confidence_0.500_Length_1692::g.15408::m.15408
MPLPSYPRAVHTREMRRWLGAALRPVPPPRVLLQRRPYYWWDSHNSVDEFRAKLVYVLRSEGVHNPDHTANRLMQSRRVHSFKDLVQHSLCSLRYYVRPPELITKVYRRVQREVGNEISATAARQGHDTDEAMETDDGKLTDAGLKSQYRGVVDPRTLRYEGPNLGNFKRYQDPDCFAGGRSPFSWR